MRPSKKSVTFEQPLAVKSRRAEGTYDDNQLAQDPFISNCKFDYLAGKHKVIAWNMVGFVGVRPEFQYTVIDVDFANKNFHRNLALNDDFGISMAAINYTGVLMASAGEDPDGLDDEYEEDEEMELD